MGKPAARIGDLHICPKIDPGPKPHVGGPILTGCPSVMIGGLPAAVKGKKLVCVGPPDTIKGGSDGVFICGQPAARMGDSCSHGGKITKGCLTVFIGDKSSNAQANTLRSASAMGSAGSYVCPYQSR